MKEAAALRERALAAQRAGRGEAALDLMAQAVQMLPGDAALLNSAGGMALRAGQVPLALDYYRRAVAVDPGALDPAINLAIALSRAQLHSEAQALLTAHEPQGQADPRYWSVRANAARQAGALAAAAHDYERCLALQPGHAKAAHGRARIALERGEAAAGEYYKAALTANPGDGEAWLGYAQALAAQGEHAEARSIAERLVAAAPGWVAALDELAQARLATGDGRDFAACYEQAAAHKADDPALWHAWARQLAGLDRFAAAADVAARARRQFPDEPQFALAEAVHAGEAGDDARAEAIFAALALATPGRRLHEARHWLRRHDSGRAQALLEQVLEDDPAHVGGWALLALCWRITGDERLDWLHGQDGLVRLLPLGMASDEFAGVAALLNSLHDRAVQPLAQSVRGGTQTRGRLFARTEPQIARLAEAVRAALEDYRQGLPPPELAHPLLRHRDAPWRLDGSWSVRLASQGHHTAHIHPRGVLSSALYVTLPSDLGEDNAGWLELGRPPPDLRLDLPPSRVIAPEVAHLALFPSSFYHGTAPFARGQRMTIAFDVVAG